MDPMSMFLFRYLYIPKKNIHQMLGVNGPVGLPHRQAGLVMWRCVSRRVKMCGTEDAGKDWKGELRDISRQFIATCSVPAGWSPQKVL